MFSVIKIKNPVMIFYVCIERHFRKQIGQHQASQGRNVARGKFSILIESCHYIPTPLPKKRKKKIQFLYLRQQKNFYLFFKIINYKREHFSIIIQQSNTPIIWCKSETTWTSSNHQQNARFACPDWLFTPLPKTQPNIGRRWKCHTRENQRHASWIKKDKSKHSSS